MSLQCWTNVLHLWRGWRLQFIIQSLQLRSSYSCDVSIRGRRHGTDERTNQMSRRQVCMSMLFAGFVRSHVFNLRYGIWLSVHWIGISRRVVSVNSCTVHRVVSWHHFSIIPGQRSLNLTLVATRCHGRKYYVSVHLGYLWRRHSLRSDWFELTINNSRRNGVGRRGRCTCRHNLLKRAFAGDTFITRSQRALNRRQFIACFLVYSSKLTKFVRERKLSVSFSCHLLLS